MDDPSAGVAAAHVGGKVLADAEDDPPPAQRGERAEGKAERMRAEQPDDVDLAQHAPEAAERPQHRQQRARAQDAGVGGQADEAELVGDAVVRARQLWIELPEQHGVLGRRGDAGDEYDERAIGVHAIRPGPIPVVGVDGDAERFLFGQITARSERRLMS